MTDILSLLIGAILVNHFVLTQYPAVHPFRGVAGRLHTDIAIAAATSLVLILSSIGAFLVYQHLLLPFGMAFLHTVIYLLIIATIVTLGGMLIRKTVPEFSGLPGIFLLLITTNAAALGVALINDNKAGTFTESAVYGCGVAAGFSLLLMLFNVLCERLRFADVPQPFQGAGIALITAGLISLTFMGFIGPA